MTPQQLHPDIQNAIVPISVDKYRRMGENGIIDEKTELISGVVIRKVNKSPLHTWTVTQLQEMVSGFSVMILSFGKRSHSHSPIPTTEISFEDTLDIHDGWIDRSVL